MSRQLTFPYPTTATKIHPDGRQDRLRYGQYEAVMIVKENGYPTDRCRILIPPRYPVTEVECDDGTKLVFDEPFYCIEECGYHVGNKIRVLPSECVEAIYEAEIRKLAHAKWEEAGKPEGRDSEFWLAAEADQRAKDM